MKMQQAFFHGRAPIDAYGNGGFRFSNISHRGSILYLPSGIYGWKSETPILTFSDMERIFSEVQTIEILLMGTGREIVFLPKEICNSLRMYHIAVDVMNTGAAVRTLNVLLSEERAVAAALFAIP